MAADLSVALAGISGYGAGYLSWLLDSEPVEPCRLVGLVDPFPERCPRVAELYRANLI